MGFHGYIDCSNLTYSKIDQICSSKCVKEDLATFGCLKELDGKVVTIPQKIRKNEYF
jgi:hypothetical protein